MKRRKKTWFLKLLIAVLLVLMAQWLGYLLAINNQERRDAKRFHAAFFVHEYEGMRDRLEKLADLYVGSQDELHLQAFDQEAGNHDLLMMARYGPTAEGGGGFREMFFNNGKPSIPLLHSAGMATFDPDEFELFSKMMDTSDKLLKMERQAVRRVEGDAVDSGKLMPKRGGLQDVKYRNELEQFDVLTAKLGDMIMSGDWYQHHEDKGLRGNWNPWVVGIGFLQAAIVVGLLWYQRYRFDHLEQRAYVDSLTELPNRWYLDMYLDWVCSRAAAHHQVVILAFIDLNSFKPINDTLGHDRGDYVLRYIAEHLKANCRSGDIATRYGGDEFVVVFVAPAHEVQSGVKRLKQLIHNTFDDACALGGELGFGAAVGISTFPTMSSSPGMLVKTADTAMYQAKEICKLGNNPLAIVEHQTKGVPDGDKKMLHVWREGTGG